MGGNVVWDSSFQRNLTNKEVSNLADMLGMLDKVYLSIGTSNDRVWKPDVKGQFLVKSFYNILSTSHGRVEGWLFFWDSSKELSRTLTTIKNKKRSSITLIDNYYD